MNDTTSNPIGSNEPPQHGPFPKELRFDYDEYVPIMEKVSADLWLKLYTEDMAQGIDDSGSLICDRCKSDIKEFYLVDGERHCKECTESHLSSLIEECKKFALDNCRITRPFPEYDSSLELRPTPDEYRDGFREAYSPSAWLAGVRHKCTNYDTLIDNDNDRDIGVWIQYLCVRQRIMTQIRQVVEGYDNSNS